MTTTTTQNELFVSLLKVTGIGPATIEKLNAAKMFLATDINQIGRQGLVGMGLSDKIALIVLDNLPEAPAAKPEPKAKKKAEPKTAMQVALEASAAKNGTTVAEVKADLPSQPKTPVASPDPKPEAVKLKDEPLIIEVDVEGLVPDGQTEMVIRNPLQMREFAEQLGFKFPENVKGVRGLRFVNATGDTVEFSTAWVMLIETKKGKKLLSIVDGSKEGVVEIAFKAIKEVHEPQGSKVRKMWLSTAISKLYAGYRGQQETRAKEAAALLRKKETARIIDEMVNEVGNDPRGGYWLTREQVVNAESPLDLLRLESMVAAQLRKDLGLDIEEKERATVNGQLQNFMAEYHKRLNQHARGIGCVDDHRELVSQTRGWGKHHQADPHMRLTALSFSFRTGGTRYLVIHDSLATAFVEAFKAKYSIKLYGVKVFLCWLELRSYDLIEQVIKGQDAKEAADYRSSQGGKDLLKAFAGEAEDTDIDVNDADASLL